MLMRLTGIVFLASAVLAGGAKADPVGDCKKLADDAAVTNCLERELRTAGRRLVQATGALERALKRVDSVQNQQIDAVPRFRAAHSKWIEFRDSECSFLGKVEGWGNAPRRTALACEIIETERRSIHYSKMADGLTQRYLD